MVQAITVKLNRVNIKWDVSYDLKKNEARLLVIIKIKMPNCNKLIESVTLAVR